MTNIHVQTNSSNAAAAPPQPDSAPFQCSHNLPFAAATTRLPIAATLPPVHPSTGQLDLGFDGEMVKTCIDLLHGDGQPFALFAKNTINNGRPIRTKIARFVSSQGAAISSFLDRYAVQADATYISLNPLKQIEGPDPSGDDVLRRKWIFLDFDTVTDPPDCNSSDSERALAWLTVMRASTWLRECGFPEPVHADSGNGFHLLYPADLFVSDGDLVKELLHIVNANVEQTGCMIDLAVFDRVRYTKLYGTYARKYKATSDRPHRLSRILSAPERRSEVGREFLLKFVRQLQPISLSLESRTVEHSLSNASSRSHVAISELVSRATAYIRKIPPAVSGKSGHTATFRTACKLVAFGLPFDMAMTLLKEWSATCLPPWSDVELHHKLSDAFKIATPGQLSKIASKSNRKENSLPELPGPVFPVSIPDFIPIESVRSLSTIDSTTYRTRNAKSGQLSTLLNWVIDWRIYAMRSNLVVIPELFMRWLVWGYGKQPKNWRAQLKGVYGETREGNTRIVSRRIFEMQERMEQLARWIVKRRGTIAWPEGHPQWEHEIRRGQPLLNRLREVHQRIAQSQCNELCSTLSDRRSHQHFGRLKTADNLGALRGLISSSQGDYVSLDFDKRNAEGQRILDALRRSSVVHSAYLPLEIFGRSRAVGLTEREIRLLQGIIRERTHRPGQGIHKGRDRVDWVRNGSVLGSSGPTTIVCPYLNQELVYVPFCGNLGNHRGRGYSLFGRSFKGWLSRAGYQVGEQFSKTAQYRMLRSFLRNLSSVSEKFGLIPVALSQSGTEWSTLAELHEKMRNDAGRRWLGTCRLRIYSERDYLARWRHWFAKQLGFSYIPGGEWQAPQVPKAADVALDSPAKVREFLRSQGMIQKDLAKAIEWTESRVSQQMAEHRRWSPKFQAAVENFAGKLVAQDEYQDSQ